jgi:hypothetical protein
VAAREIALIARLMDLRRKMAAHKKRNETTTMIIEKACKEGKREVRGTEE